jgi:hypothetical protein
MRRRTLVAGAVGVAASAAAGCLGAVGMDEYEATPAGVEPAVREETGYERTAVEEQVVERTVDAGVSEEITVRNYRTEHEKEVDLGPIGTAPAATFTVFTSPQISIAGRNFNPIAGMSATELVDLIEADSGGLSNVEHVEDSEATVLGQTTPESVFEGDAELGSGVSVDVNVNVTESVETTDDHLVTVGVYPRNLAETEADDVAAMIGGVIEDPE